MLILDVWDIGGKEMKYVSTLSKRATLKNYRPNLQLFADEGAGSEGEDGGQGGSDGEAGSETFTKSDVDRMISKAIEKRDAKLKADFELEKQEAIEKAKAEGESYAKLTEKEKQDKQLSERQSALDAREKEIQLKELKSDIAVDLKEKGIPTTLADTLARLGTAEEIKEFTKTLASAIDEAASAKVKETLRQNTPPEGSPIGSSGGTSIADIARKARLI